MIDEPADKPDITLTLDREGVIRHVARGDALEHESFGDWEGRPFGETVPPGLSERVASALRASRDSGESQSFRVRQRLPSGREMPLEYTTVSLGRGAGLVAIGRNLQNMSDLQSRLIDATRAREQDFWRLRDIERRYRAVLDASAEAVALVRASNMRVVEANLQAARAVGLLPGAEFLPDLAMRDRRGLEGALEQARVQGRAPSIVLHLGAGAQWSLRASLIESDADAFYLLQMSPLQAAVAQEPEVPLEALLRRLPDAFVIADEHGAVLRANPTFLDLAQVAVEGAVIGQNLRRWLSHAGEDFPVVAGLVQRHGSVRMLRCRLEGELGAMTEVEISAVGDRAPRPRAYGLMMRDVSPRGSRAAAGGLDLSELTGGLAIPADPLEAVVGAAIETIERRLIEEALARHRGNRTLAARHLGLSRQTLHVKLNKYKLDRL